jgi:YidC/Oxa1 family membrane protein insertase
MGITMWFQMQLNPQQPDPLQQKIFNLMPILFTFLLAAFPAGLVIYWAWNNILSLGQQWLIMKRQGVEVPIVANLKRNLAPVTGLVTGKRPNDKAAAKPATPSTSKSPATERAPEGNVAEAGIDDADPVSDASAGKPAPQPAPSTRSSRRAEARARKKR